MTARNRICIAERTMIKRIRTHRDLREYLLLWKRFSEDNTECVIFGTPRSIAIDTMLTKLDKAEESGQSLAMFIYNLAIDVFGINLMVADMFAPLVKAPTIGIIIIPSESQDHSDEILFMLRTSGSIPPDAAGLTLFVPADDIPPYEMPVTVMNGSTMLPVHLILIEER